MSPVAAFGLGVSVTSGLLSFAIYFLRTDRAKAVYGASCAFLGGAGLLLIAFGG